MKAITTILLIIVIGYSASCGVGKYSRPGFMGRTYQEFDKEQEEGIQFAEDFLRWQKENDLPKAQSDEEGRARIQQFREFYAKHKEF